MESQPFHHEPARKTPVAARVDVVVCGAGPAGYGAALGAARTGASTLLIERMGIPGGTSTAVMMNAWKCPLENLNGVAREAADALIQRGGAFPGGQIAFDPGALVEVEIEKLMEARVQLLLHVWAVEPIMEGRRVRGVIVQGKSGRQAILAKAVVDTTGDGDIAELAGVPTSKGREEDGKMRSATSLFRIGGIDMQEMLAYVHANPDEFHKDPARHHVKAGSDAIGIVGFYRMVEEARARGEVPDEVHFLTLEGFDPHHGLCSVNSSRVYDMDGTNMWDVTRGEIEARRQNKAIFEFMKKRIPGFRDSYVIGSSSMLGVRETRRVVGQYFLTDDDLMAGKTYPDSVARLWRYISKKGYDGHSPDGNEGAKDDNEHHSVGRALRSFEIPYGCVVPKEVEGMTVGGRIISQTRGADWWTRGQYCCMVTGQVAGTAAGLSALNGMLPGNLDVSLLQRELVRQGLDIGEVGSRLAPLTVP